MWVARAAVPVYAGIDFRIYRDAAQRWMEGASFYLPHQLAGRYEIQTGDVLYPPNALVIFAPFVYLPAVLWWLIPIGVIGAVVWLLRPAPWAWPFIALCLAWPPTALTIVVGNPVLWMVAAFALGLRYRWPAVLVFLKPAVFPFAFWGGRSGEWWKALIGLAFVSLAFGSMWFDWLITLANSNGTLLYSIQQVPLFLIPLVAWLGRSRSQRATGELTRV